MIKVSGLSRVFETPGETIRVLEGLDLEVGDGEAMAIVGPSGSGKTTLLNLLGALDRPTAGRIEIGGEEVSSLDEKAAAAFRNRSLGFIFQQHYLLPQLSVLENVLVPRLAGGWEETPAETGERARQLLESVGLTGRSSHFPYQLSGGEKLRVAVARALVNRPSLVLADEPTGSLDAAATEKVADLLLGMNREHQTTLVVVTHNLELARRIGSVRALGDGKLEPWNG